MNVFKSCNLFKEIIILTPKASNENQKKTIKNENLVRPTKDKEES